MINFFETEKSEPYLKFKDFYDSAIAADQKNIEAFSISSYNNETCEVNSRFVNIKYIKQNKFFFFSNYNSPKSHDFKEHNQIAVNTYWNKINAQVRLKAYIYKAKPDESDKHFMTRSIEKNTLAISSNQSMPINSYDEVLHKYESQYDKSINNIPKRPDYWGGFFFIPYFFEFWEGNSNRLNKRTSYRPSKDTWFKEILEP